MKSAPRRGVFPSYSPPFFFRWALRVGIPVLLLYVARVVLGLLPLLFIGLFGCGRLHQYLFLCFSFGAGSYVHVAGDGAACVCMMHVVVSFFVVVRGVFPSAPFPRNIFGSLTHIHVAGVAWHAYARLVASSFLAFAWRSPFGGVPRIILGSHTVFL